jgi:hypothetical protein
MDKKVSEPVVAVRSSTWCKWTRTPWCQAVHKQRMAPAAALTSRHVLEANIEEKVRAQAFPLASACVARGYDALCCLLASNCR